MGQQQATRVNASTQGVARQNTPAAKPQINNAVGQLGAGIQNLQGANLAGVQNAANAAQNVNVAPMQQVAQGLQGFNPIQGPAMGTLQNIIATGNPVNVDPITQAAQQQAQLTFGNLMPQVNEQFGALGLGSSSAREAELARQAGQISTGVGIEGLRAGVGAQENAAQRQLAGFNPLLQGTGQQLAGMQSAGQLQGQAAGLQLQGAGTAGQLRLGAAGEENQFNLGRVNAGQNFVNPLLSAQNQQMNMPPAGGGGGGGAPAQQQGNPFAMLQGRAPLRQMGGLVPEMAQGGRVDYGDYLSNMLFGQQFTRRGAEPQLRPVSAGKSSSDRERDFLQNQLLKAQVGMMNRRPITPSGRQGMQNTGALAQGLLGGTRAYRQPGDMESLTNMIGLIGVPAAHAGLMQSGSLLGQRSVDARGEAAVQGANAAGDQQRQTYQWMINQGINPMTGQRMREGGEVDGPSVPPDVVPIMAQGGELVVPIPLRHKIEMSNSTDPIVQELKGLIDKPVDPHGMQGGGSVFDRLRQGGLFDALVGKSPTEIGSMVSRGESPVQAGNRPDLATHALASKLLAERIGVLPARALGVGNEVAGGLLGLATGEGFFGDRGFDLRDLDANERGFEAARGGLSRFFQKGGKVGRVMHEFKEGELHSGSSTGPKVTSREQAIAIALSEAGKSKNMQAGGPVMRRGQIDLNAPSFGEGLRSGRGQLMLPQAFQQTFAPHMPQAAPAPMPQAPQGFDQGQRSFTDRDLQGGFSVTGAEPDPLYDAEQQMKHANARVNLLSSLALRATAGPRQKLAGLIAAATGERDAAAARFDVLKRTQMMQQAAQAQQQMADQAAMQRLETEQKGLASREQARTEREMEANQLRTEAELFAKGGAGNELSPGFDPRTAQSAVEAFRAFQSGQAPPPVADISQLASMPGAQLPQVLSSIDFASVPQTPENVQSAQQMLRNLASMMPLQDIRVQHKALLDFLGLQ